MAYDGVEHALSHIIGGNTAGVTAVISSSQMMLAGGNNITLSQNGNSVTISAGAGGGGDAIRGIAANGSTASTNTVNFSNSNGISFGFGAAGNSTVLTASHNALTSQSTQFLAMTLGGNTAGTTTFNATNNASLFFHGGNNITLSGNGASVTISAFAQTVQTQNLHNVTLSGNTAGVMAQVSSGTMTLAGGNNITLSQNGNAITISAGAGGGGGAATISRWNPGLMGMATSAAIATGASGNTGGSTQFTASGCVFPMAFPHQLEYVTGDMIMTLNATSAGTGSATVGHLLGIYTLNAGTALSLISSSAWTMIMSQNSVTARTHSWGWSGGGTSASLSLGGNLSASFSGIRALQFVGTTGTISAHPLYYFAHMMTQRTSSVNVYGVAGIGYRSGSQTTNASYIGFSNLNVQSTRFMGIFSTTTNVSTITGLVMPSSIHTSVITGSGGTSQRRMPWLEFYRNT